LCFVASFLLFGICDNCFMKNCLKNVFLVILITGCGKEAVDSAQVITQNPPIQTRPDPTPQQLPSIKKVPYQNHQWRLGWSDTVAFTAKDLEFDKIEVRSQDLIEANCPGYAFSSSDQRLGFWIVFIAAMAQEESSFNESLRYYENGLGKYSEGLLQLSTSDAYYHSGCRGIDSETILVGEENLACGLSILKEQLNGKPGRGITPGTLFPSSYYYWSVLTKAVTRARIGQFIKNHWDQLPFCH